MKGASKVIMGTTLAIAIALSIVLSFILILLAELYCSLLLNRRRKTQHNTAITTANNIVTLPAPGVLLHAPRSILFPKNIENNIDNNNNNNLDLENQKQIESPKEHLVYICNPIYDNEAMCQSGPQTPYETPESSPSHLGYSDEEDIECVYVCIDSPELKPMEKLQAEACSVSLRDASSLATSPSGSDTNTNNGVSTTVSGSPSTSW